MGSLSRQKGKRGEREWAAFLSGNGCAARRGVQYQGGPDSPDVVCEALASFHFEVKRTEALQLFPALAQACSEAPVASVPVVAHRKNRTGWVVVMRAEDWIALALMAKVGAALAAKESR